MFTVTVLPASATEVDPPHPDRDHQFRLVETLRRLPPSHALAYCGGCEWYLRWPTRAVDDPEMPEIGELAHTHLASAHFDAVLAGRACFDPDLTDGGAEYLRARIDAVAATVGR